MSGFGTGNRRGAELYGNLQGLNAPADYDLSMPLPQQPHSGAIGFEDSDLSMFANADILNFDWDEATQQHFKPDVAQNNFDFGTETFQSPTDFNFDLSNPEAFAQQPLVQPFLQGVGQDARNFATDTQSPSSSSHKSPQSTTSSSMPSAPKRAREVSTDDSEKLSPDEVARHAADEDKRRRNTAASARFRVKKKQREQQMEQTAREMSDKVKMLESKVNKLEDENQFLRGLITEKEGKTIDIDALRKSKAEAKDKKGVKAEAST